VEQELVLKPNELGMYLQSFLNTTWNRNASFQALAEWHDTTNKNSFVRKASQQISRARAHVILVLRV